jgi:hypothetical protein
MNSESHGVKPAWHSEVFAGSVRKSELHNGIGEDGGKNGGGFCATVDAVSCRLTRPNAAEAKAGCMPAVAVEIEDVVFEGTEKLKAIIVPFDKCRVAP